MAEHTFKIDVEFEKLLDYEESRCVEFLVGEVCPVPPFVRFQLRVDPPIPSPQGGRDSYEDRRKAYLARPGATCLVIDGTIQAESSGAAFEVISGAASALWGDIPRGDMYWRRADGSSRTIERGSMTLHPKDTIRITVDAVKRVVERPRAKSTL